MSVRITIRVDSIYKCLSVNNWIVNHLGINPRNGGIPLREKKLIIKNNFKLKL